MAATQLTIPDDKVTEVLEAFDSMFHGRGDKTKAQWLKLCLIDHVKKVVQAHRVNKAKAQAVTEEITIT